LHLYRLHNEGKLVRLFGEVALAEAPPSLRGRYAAGKVN
jgi:hypothetical protein